MKSLNILDRHLNIDSHYLIEASAGTGKTFAIENLVVRLLLAEEPQNVTLDQLLVVTFTRSATRDLKMRIRSNLERSVKILTGDPSYLPPDYLIAYMEQSPEKIAQGIKRLEDALFCFDKAQIFTIHGFCARTLQHHLFEGDLAVDVSKEPTSLNVEMVKAMRDYIRTELRSDLFSNEQLHLLAKEHHYSMEKLEAALLKILKSPLDIAPQPDFLSQLQRFRQAMEGLLQEWRLEPEKIVDDFITLAPGYQQLCDRQRKVKPEILNKITSFAQLFDCKECSREDFDRLLADGLLFVTALDPSKQLTRCTTPDHVHYPGLHAELQKKLSPLVEEAAHPVRLLVRMAQGCQEMLRRIFSEEEKLSYDGLLSAMLKAATQDSFCSAVRKNSKAVIIDEFQDTDPIQWQVFKNIFLSDALWDRFYVVGDPKQSIYAFRQADIYTYLSAAELLGQENHLSLDTNYRSRPRLIHALNALFSQEAAPGMIFLPRLEKTVNYTAVKPPPSAEDHPFKDDRGAVHFLTATAEDSPRKGQISLEALESAYFFPFIAQELIRLHREESIRFSQCAILVSDRFQAGRLSRFLRAHAIPSSSQRSYSLAESPALEALYELLKALLSPRDDSALKTALGGKILGWNHLQIRSLQEMEQLEKVMAQLHRLRRVLFEKGFPAFWDLFLHSHWQESRGTVLEHLLKQEEGLSFYEDLQQLAEILLEEHQDTYTNQNALLELLDRLKTLDIEEEERLRKVQNSTQETVQILTVHSSKGLEFGIVFALGLITRTKAPSELVPIPSPSGGLPQLSVITDTQNAHYLSHCRELDAEKMRQLYVAMTRAKERVYAPIILFSSNKAPDTGCASPMELFLARLGQPEIADTQLYAERLNGYDGAPLYRFLEQMGSSASVTIETLPYKPEIEQHLPENAIQTCVPPLLIVVPTKGILLQSFTSLAQKKEREKTGKTAPHDFEAAYKTIDLLPAGIETGNVLHRILETFPFGEVQKAASSEELHPIVRPYLQGSSLSGWLGSISEILFRTLRTPLPCAEESIRLCDLSQEQRYHEIEFLYPRKAFSTVPSLLKGVIDLIFSYQGRYYLLDWKSNWLGEGPDAYRPEQLAIAMEQYDYLLQAELYKEALARFLKLTETRPFEELFGGTFYLFLRGLTGDSDRGVYKVD